MPAVPPGAAGENFFGNRLLFWSFSIFNEILPLFPGDKGGYPPNPPMLRPALNFRHLQFQFPPPHNFFGFASERMLANFSACALL